jgi:hypothetical protein
MMASVTLLSNADSTEVAEPLEKICKLNGDRKHVEHVKL